MNQKEKLFFDKLKDIFVGVKIEGKSGFINLMRIKSSYFDIVFKELNKEIEEKTKDFPDFKEEMFDKLYTFFKTYFSEAGSIYFNYTPLKAKIYERIYSPDKDVILFWKTHMLYYVKTDRLWHNLTIDFDEDGVKYKINFDVSKLQHKKANEKREIIYELKEIKDREITFSVLYSERGRKTKIGEILKAFKKENIHLDEERLLKLFRTYEKQNEVDYFINKNAEQFLKEQFDLWLKNYLFDDESDFSERRLKQLKVLKEIAYKVIDFVAQFEDELVKIWNKPKFVLNSNYVITLDRIAKKEGGIEFIEKIVKHKGFEEQKKEWKDLGIIKDFDKGKLFINTPNGKELNKGYQFLPIDTKYFGEDIKLELLSLFDDLDSELDGWLIHSENYQALKTILPKFKEKVQTIYIDPPYNTGSDEFIYRDTFRHSSWLSLMENRISLSLQLLRDSGNFCCSINENELYNLKLLMDEIFTKSNYLGNFIIKVRHEERILKGDKDVHEVTENLLYYRKTKEHIIGKIKKENTSIEEYVWEIKEEGKPDRIVEMGGKKVDIFKPDNFQIIKGSPSKNKLKRINIRGSIRQGNSSGRFYVKYLETNFEKFRGYLFKVYNMGDDALGYRYFYIPDESSKRKNGDYFQGMPTNRNEILEIPYPNYFDMVDEFNRTGYEGPKYFGTGKKPEAFIKKIIEISNCKTNEIILDIFLGSGTTTAVAHKLRRKWIGVEMAEHFWTVVLPRMKKVLFYDKAGISEKKDVKEKYNSKTAGGFFKYYSLEQYEQTLRRAVYKPSHPFINFDDKSIYQQYVFMKDLKLLDAMKLDYENNKIKINFDEIYPNIDLAETLSNLTGKWIKKIEKNAVIFEDGSRIDFDNIDFKVIKPLIWW